MKFRDILIVLKTSILSEVNKAQKEKYHISP